MAKFTDTRELREYPQVSMTNGENEIKNQKNHSKRSSMKKRAVNLHERAHYQGLTSQDNRRGTIHKMPYENPALLSGIKLWEPESTLVARSYK